MDCSLSQTLIQSSMCSFKSNDGFLYIMKIGIMINNVFINLLRGKKKFSTSEINEIKIIPFFKLKTAFESGDISKNTQLFLYCDKGIMSRLHASYLVEKGYSNVGVYRPR